MAFNDELIRILSRRGLTLGSNGVWERMPHYRGGNPVTDEQLRFVNETNQRRQSDTDARLRRQWIENLNHVVEELDQHGLEAPWPFQSLFWIRLHGVFMDLRSWYSTVFQTIGIDPGTYVSNHGSAVEFAVMTFRAIECLRDQFTEDELIYADYRRHTESHPTQTSYNVRWSQRGAAVVDRHGVPSIGREFTVAELDAAVQRVLAAHPSEAAIAVALARRVRGPLQRLTDQIRRGSPQ
jgi:hypothetical protein